MTTNFPCTDTYGKLKEFLLRIRTIQKPAKCTVRWLMQLGFKSTGHRVFLPVLKFIGLTAQDGTPTDMWNRYRGNEYKTVLGEGIRNGYSGLFSMYGEAHKPEHRRDVESFFSVASGQDKKKIDRIVGTFYALCAMAEFNGDTIAEVLENTPAAVIADSVPNASISSRPSAKAQGIPMININISLVLPETREEEVYDKLFLSLKKHLLS